MTVRNQGSPLPELTCHIWHHTSGRGDIPAFTPVSGDYPRGWKRNLQDFKSGGFTISSNLLRLDRQIVA